MKVGERGKEEEKEGKRKRENELNWPYWSVFGHSFVLMVVLTTNIIEHDDEG